MSIEQITVFISYRRATSRHFAGRIFENLRQDGYDAFLDVDGIDSGAFDTIILNHIAARANFVLIVSHNSLLRCNDSTDWVRQEIEEAVRLNRNVVPIYDADEITDYAAELESLPLNIRETIARQNAIPFHHYYFAAGMEKLQKCLKSNDLITVESLSSKEALEASRRIEKAIKFNELYSKAKHLIQQQIKDYRTDTQQDLESVRAEVEEIYEGLGDANFRANIQHFSIYVKEERFVDALNSLKSAMNDHEPELPSGYTEAQPQSVVNIRKPQLNCLRTNILETNQRAQITTLHYLSAFKLVLGHNNGTVAFWDKNTNAIYPSTPMPEESASRFPMSSIASSRDGRFIAYPLPKKEIQIIDSNANKPMSLKTEDLPISVAFSPNNRWLIAGHDETGWLEVWDVAENFRRVSQSFKAHQGRIEGICFHPTKSRFATISSAEDVIKLWSIDNGSIALEKEKFVEERIVGKRLHFSSVAYSPKGDLIAVGCGMGGFLTWNPHESIAPYVHRNQSIRTIAFSPDGNFLVVPEDDNSVRIYPVDSGSPSSAIESKKFDQQVQCLAFSPDGKTLAIVKLGEKFIQFCDVIYS